MKDTNSPLTVYTRLSRNHSGQRTRRIDRITPHCAVGQCTAEELGEFFASPSIEASSNYGIDKYGRVGLYVEEKNRSWCSSSNENDQRAVTIECASDPTEPYAFRNAVYQTLIALCTDICERYGKKKLLWFGDKDKTLNYSPKPDEMILTVHRWFEAKSCPGDWMYERMGDLADRVTARLGGSSAPKDSSPHPQGKEVLSDTSKAGTMHFDPEEPDRVSADYLISVGPHCRPAEQLKVNGLKRTRFPLDWMGFSADTLIHCMETDFSDFFLEYEETPYEGALPQEKHAVRDIRNDILSVHHLPIEQPLEEAVRDLRALTAQRREAFHARMANAGTAILVGAYDDPEDAHRILQAFRNRSPNMTFRIVNLSHRENCSETEID